MALTWNLQQERLILRHGKDPKRTEEATADGMDIEVPEDEVPSREEVTIDGNTMDIQVSEDGAPPTKKVQSVVHGRTSAPAPARNIQPQPRGIQHKNQHPSKLRKQNMTHFRAGVFTRLRY